MPDILDQLRDLGGATLTGPEPLDALRARTTRRRRRQRMAFAPVGLAAVVAVVALVASNVTEDRDRGVRTVDAPAQTTTTVAPITEPLTEWDLSGQPGSYIRVVSDRTGIILTILGPELRPKRVTDRAALLGFGTYSGRLVAQYLDEGSAAPGDVVVFEAGGERVLVSASAPQAAGGYIELHDVGQLDGRDVAVVSEVASGVGPEDWDVRLLLVDVETAARTDLGSVAGWEQGVRTAKLTTQGVVVLRSSNAGDALELRRLDGSTAWEVPDLGDTDVVRSMTLHGSTPSDVFVLEPGFEGEDRRPRIRVRRFDPVTGAEGDALNVTLQLEPGLEIDGGYCAFAESGGMALLCSQSDGPTIWIELRDGETRAVPGGPDHGTMTWWRPY